MDSIESGQAGTAQDLFDPPTAFAATGADNPQDSLPSSSSAINHIGGFDVFLHFIFKIGAFATYQFGPLFFGGTKRDDFVFTFVLTVLWLSADFWVVKNVTGWRMCGMAWFYSEDADAGVEGCTKNEGHWYFRYADENVESRWKSFWIGLSLWPLYWCLSGLSYFFSLDWDWVVVAAIGLTLSGINFTGYWRCSKYSKGNSMEQWIMSNPLVTQVTSLARFIPFLSRASSSTVLPK